MARRGNLANLRPWRRGQPSPNPGGRPKTLTSLRELLVKRYGQDAKALVERLDALSKHRNPNVALQATEQLLAYHSGKPTQPKEHAEEEPMPMFILPPGTEIAVDVPEHVMPPIVPKPALPPEDPSNS